jgi:hypothetical protein
LQTVPSGQLFIPWGYIASEKVPPGHQLFGLHFVHVKEFAGKYWLGMQVISDDPDVQSSALSDPFVEVVPSGQSIFP